jgi:hypothetical protein
MRDAIEADGAVDPRDVIGGFQLPDGRVIQVTDSKPRELRELRRWLGCVALVALAAFGLALAALWPRLW